MSLVPAQLQHPTDANGEEFEFESSKPMATLTITSSISGTLSAADPGGSGLTNTVTYSGTLTGTLSRAPFVPRDYYPDFTPPDDGDFFLTSDCCCWKCRWRIITPFAGIVPTGSIAWNSTWAGAGAPPDTSGTLDATMTFTEGFIPSDIPPGGEGYAAQREANRASLCHEAGESGRLGQLIRVFFPALTNQPGNGYTTPPLSWTYTDTNGSDAGGPSDPPPDMIVESASCEDSVSVSATLIFNGTDTVGGVTSTVSALTYAMTFDLS